MFCGPYIHSSRGNPLAAPNGEKHRLSHISRRPGANLGSVDGSPLFHRAPENGTAHAGRECSVPDRTTSAGRPARGHQKSWGGRHGVQRRLAVLCQRRRETTPRTRSRELDERQREPGRRVVQDRETCAQMRAHVGSRRRQGHGASPQESGRYPPVWRELNHEGQAQGSLSGPEARSSHFAVDIALSVVSDPSGAFLANTATWSPAAKSLETIFNSVTGVLGGTVTF
jgi:hypothetical protein